MPPRANSGIWTPFTTKLYLLHRGKYIAQGRLISDLGAWDCNNAKAQLQHGQSEQSPRSRENVANVSIATLRCRWTWIPRSL
jgi:hypothetical protein